MYTDEQIEQFRKLTAMMRASGVSKFATGELDVTFDSLPQVPTELTQDEKLAFLKEELQKSSKDADEDLYYSV